MKKTAQEIVREIKELVDELSAISSTRPSTQGPSARIKPQAKKGASGALSILIEERFFDSPKHLSAVMSKLKEIGRYYPKPTVSMNLLNLTRRRILTRIPDNKTKNWLYVLRR
jgi:hypothetical protein